MKARKIALVLAAASAVWLTSSAIGQCQTSSPAGITMSIYPVERGADGLQYIITPSGKRVTIPGLGIAPNATQVSVYRDQNNNFWYTSANGQAVAVTPQQLEYASAQINSQSAAAQSSVAQQAPSPQGAYSGQPNYYSSSPSYASGFNGIPYGTPINMESPGQYSYVAPGGNKQYVAPTPQTSEQFNQWQQQTPYQAASAPVSSAAASGSQNSTKSGGDRPFSRMRERRINRLDDRAQDQTQNANNDKSLSTSNMDSGNSVGAGFRARQSAREQRRAKREDRRADRLQKREQNLSN